MCSAAASGDAVGSPPGPALSLALALIIAPARTPSIRRLFGPALAGEITIDANKAIAAALEGVKRSRFDMGPKG